MEEKKNTEGKGGIYLEKKINGDVDDNQPTDRANIVQTALSKVKR